MKSPIKSQWTLAEIAALIGGTVLGDPDTLITGVAGVEEAGDGDLVFAESAAFLAKATACAAAAVLVPEAPTPLPAKPLIQVEAPRLAFVRFLEALFPPVQLPAGIHPTAQIGTGLSLGVDVRIGPHVVIGDDVTLGDGVQVFAGVFIDDGCRIGAGSLLFPHVVLYPNVKIGQRCILHAGAVLGTDGFGFLPIGRGLRKIPHLGSVEVADDVEIGANTTIDRAKTGVTYIGPGTKIDNLVHIAHNVRIGPSCVMAAQVGIAGSSSLGAGVMLGGQVGLKDHVHLGDGVQVGAQSGIMKSTPPGEVVFGSPATPVRQHLKEIAATARLPEALKKISALEKRLAALEKLLPESAAAETE